MRDAVSYFVLLTQYAGHRDGVAARDCISQLFVELLDTSIVVSTLSVELLDTSVVVSTQSVHFLKVGFLQASDFRARLSIAVALVELTAIAVRATEVEADTSLVEGIDLHVSRVGDARDSRIFLFAQHSVDATVESDILEEGDLKTTTTEEEEATLRRSTRDGRRELTRDFAITSTEVEVRRQTARHIQTSDEVTPVHAELVVQVEVERTRSLRS